MTSDTSTENSFLDFLVNKQGFVIQPTNNLIYGVLITKIFVYFFLRMNIVFGK